MKKDSNLGVELLKILIQPGYVYFKCTDGEVYRAEIETPDPTKPLSIPRLVPKEASDG